MVTVVITKGIITTTKNYESDSNNNTNDKTEIKKVVIKITIIREIA